MDLESEILRKHSKRQAGQIARLVDNDKTRFTQLMELFLRGDYRVSQTVLTRIAKQEPNLRHETMLVIERLIPYGSAGIKARGKKVLQMLR